MVGWFCFGFFWGDVLIKVCSHLSSLIFVILPISMCTLLIYLCTRPRDSLLPIDRKEGKVEGIE